jgi:hypothetical protein
MKITRYTPIRRAAMLLSATAVVALVATASIPGALAQDDKQQLNMRIDERLGLLERTLRIWKLPIRHTASRSPYFKPGLPPYRQQPEKAQEQTPPGLEPEPVAAPTPEPSGGGSSSADSGGGSDSSSDGGGNDSGQSNDGGGDGSGSDDDDGGSSTVPILPTPGTA